MKIKTLLGLLVSAAVFTGAVAAQEKTLTITIAAGQHHYKNVPVCVPFELPATFKNPAIRQLTGGDAGLSWQQTLPGLLTENLKNDGKVHRELHLLIPELQPGVTVTLAARVTDLPAKIGGLVGKVGTTNFGWRQHGGETDLFLYRLSKDGVPAKGRRLVARYVHWVYDNSSLEKRDRTYKVFHHLFDPSGKRLVTNGGWADDNIRDPKKLLYPHHRGLMYAFNRITYDNGKQCDTWHAKPGDTHEEHAGFMDMEAGPTLARQRVLIDWHGPDNKVFAREERELTFYNIPGGTLVDFASRLRTRDGKVILDGDPQHAGFQFRAANAVAEKTEKQTYFLRPDGKGKPNDTRNWDPKTRKGPVGLPWDAMCFVLDGQRYTVAYLNNPANLGEQRYSERAYGRIGCYFKYDLTKEQPLTVRYRVWLQDGEMTVPQVQALDRAFIDPPRVTVK
jgi:hypothetical protein